MEVFVNPMLSRTIRNANLKHHTVFSLLRRNLSASSRSAVIEKAVEEGEFRVFIVSGEVSGDAIGSRLMASLKKLSPLPVRFSGVGGSLMSKHGFSSLFPIEDISVMGIWELIPHLYKIRARLKETIEAALRFKPHVVVTVDSKGFSFRLLKQLRVRYNQLRLGAPTHFHYIAPSFWAWKGGEARLNGLSGFVDHIFCILPNEAEVCRANGLAATFVGHPILQDAFEPDLGKSFSPQDITIKGDSDGFKLKNAIPDGAMVLSLLPGSRLQEVTRMIKIFSNTVELLLESFPELVTVVHVARNCHVEKFIDTEVHKWPTHSILIPGGFPSLKYDALSASNVALCTSGTVALEMQLARLPCVVAYRAHILTECFIRYKAKIPYISLPNILLDSPIIPEALFQACTDKNLAPLLTELIRNDGLREKQINAAEKVIELLCPPKQSLNCSFSETDLKSPSTLAASIILSHTNS